MNLPEIKNPLSYKGMYVVDFGDHSSIGYTAEEVEMLLESEKFSHIKVYKIHNVHTDGKIELKGVPNQTFQLEQGMFFYSYNIESAKKDFNTLTHIAVSCEPPCRAKLHLAKYSEDRFVNALIFPAESNDEISKWLIQNNYKSSGIVTGGYSDFKKYHEEKPEILERHQFISSTSIETRDLEEILKSINNPIQRLAG